MKGSGRPILQDAHTRDRVAALALQARPHAEGESRLPSHIPDSRCQTAPAPPRRVLQTHLASEDGRLIAQSLFVVNNNVSICSQLHIACGYLRFLFREL